MLNKESNDEYKNINKLPIDQLEKASIILSFV